MSQYPPVPPEGKKMHLAILVENKVPGFCCYVSFNQQKLGKILNESKWLSDEELVISRLHDWLL